MESGFDGSNRFHGVQGVCPPRVVFGPPWAACIVFALGADLVPNVVFVFADAFIDIRAGDVAVKGKECIKCDAI